jgi:hypothetical protein
MHLQLQSTISKWTSFFATYRSVLTAKLVHLHRPDSRSLEAVLHVPMNASAVVAAAAASAATTNMLTTTTTTTKTTSGTAAGVLALLGLTNPSRNSTLSTLGLRVPLYYTGAPAHHACRVLIGVRWVGAVGVLADVPWVVCWGHLYVCVLRVPWWSHKHHPCSLETVRGSFARRRRCCSMARALKAPGGWVYVAGGPTPPMPTARHICTSPIHHRPTCPNCSSATRQTNPKRPPKRPRPPHSRSSPTAKALRRAPR